MNKTDQQYIDLLNDILENGTWKKNRTGVQTISVFGRQLHFNLQEGFPILTTKKIYWKAVVHELLWFLKGTSSIKYLQDNNITIWDEWAKDGDLGPVYGVQWRNWNGIDQIKNVIENIKKDPDSRRLIVSAWNVSDLPKMALAPCHLLINFGVTNNKLNCHWFQRSVDTFLGLPFNISSYALLTHMIAQVCGLEVGELVWSGTDVHIYENHMEQVLEQLSNKSYDLPRLMINPDIKDIDDFKYTDFSLQGYQACPTIKAPIAI